MVLDNLDHSINSDYTNLYGGYNDIFRELKVVPPQCNIEH